MAGRLRTLKSELGQAYWQDAAAAEMRETLRRLIGRYGAWAPDGLPEHQRARAAARYESTLASLLWPGRADE